MGFFMVFFCYFLASNEGFQVDGEILQIRRVHILAVTDDALHLVVDRLARCDVRRFSVGNRWQKMNRLNTMKCDKM